MMTLSVATEQQCALYAMYAVYDDLSVATEQQCALYAMYAVYDLSVATEQQCSRRAATGAFVVTHWNPGPVSLMICCHLI